MLSGLSGRPSHVVILVSESEDYSVYALMLCPLGDIGVGAMTEWRDIVNVVVDRFKLQMKS